MTGRDVVAMIALGVLAWEAPASAQDRPTSTSVDVRARPMDAIPPGTVIGDGAPKGWTNLVLLATPRIGVGDVDEVPHVAASYSRMFLFAVLGKVRSERTNDGASFVLDKVAIGTALDVNGRNVIADGQNTFGADLGIIGRSVLAENERILKEDFKQVARTPTMVIFDANAFVLRDRKHKTMILRHVVLASPSTGKVSTFVWLLGSDGASGYALADKGLQKLPQEFREDRVLSVDGQRFTFGIPSADAFALAKIPQGTALGFSEALKGVAATKQFTAQTASKLEAELQARYAPAADRPKVAPPVRE